MISLRPTSSAWENKWKENNLNHPLTNNWNFAEHELDSCEGRNIINEVYTFYIITFNFMFKKLRIKF